MTAADAMTDNEVRLMTTIYHDSWPGSKSARDERALAAVLRNFTWDEADAALDELILQCPELPTGQEITTRVEAIRRRGTQPTPVATKGQRARGLLSARRAVMLCQAKSA